MDFTIHLLLTRLPTTTSPALPCALEAAFYANNIHYQDLKDTTFCANEINFRAEIEGELHPNAGHLKWYINGVEEISARDHVTWSKPFTAGEYEIKMWVRFANNETTSLQIILSIPWIKIRNIKH